MSDTDMTNVRPPQTLRQQFNLVSTFAQRDLKTRFKGSALGWLWSLVVPLATLAIYSVVFSVIFRAQPPHMGNRDYGIFVLWLFCGLIFWTFFSTSINSGISELRAAGPILQKVYFPAFTPILGTVMAVGTQSLIEVGVLVAVMAVMLNIGVSWLLLPFWVILAIIFTASLTTIVAIMNIYYRDLAHLVSVILQLLFYLTPIIYPMTLVPEVWKGLPLHTLLGINPLTSFVQLFRALVYELNFGSPWMWFNATVWTMAVAALAVYVSRTKGADLGEHV